MIVKFGESRPRILKDVITIVINFVEQVHERDRFSDFLLTVLREALNKFRNLKLIVMSATADVQLFL